MCSATLLRHTSFDFTCFFCSVTVCTMPHWWYTGFNEACVHLRRAFKMHDVSGWLVWLYLFCRAGYVSEWTCELVRSKRMENASWWNRRRLFVSFDYFWWIRCNYRIQTQRTGVLWNEIEKKNIVWLQSGSQRSDEIQNYIIHWKSG